MRFRIKLKLLYSKTKRPWTCVSRDNAGADRFRSAGKERHGMRASGNRSVNGKESVNFGKHGGLRLPKEPAARPPKSKSVPISVTFGPIFGPRPAVEAQIFQFG